MELNNLNYDYVYFNSNYGRRWEVNPFEYNAICLHDLANVENVQVVQCPLYYTREWVRKVFCIHSSKRYHIILPFQNVWYPFYYKKKSTNKPLCFVVANNDIPIRYLEYLKRRNPDCRIVKVHRDLIKVSYKNPEYSEENMNKIFDLRLCYDPEEAKKYGFVAFDEIESKIEIPTDEKYPLCDVFFAGRAKDRLSKLVKAYDIFDGAGLKCDFYITDVNAEERVFREGITYSDSFMPYYDMLYKSVNARCMLDINQEGAVGYTSRFLEAIMYNKKIIADNAGMLKSKYYNPRFIQYIERVEDIDPDFVRSSVDVKYDYEGDFSPVYLIQKIDKALAEMNGVKQ